MKFNITSGHGIRRVMIFGFCYSIRITFMTAPNTIVEIYTETDSTLVKFLKLLASLDMETLYDNLLIPSLQDSNPFIRHISRHTIAERDDETMGEYIQLFADAMKDCPFAEISRIVIPSPSRYQGRS